MIMAAAVALALVSVGGLFALRSDSQALADSGKTSVEKSTFSFNGTNGWRKGPTNGASLALFSDDHSCFTSIERKHGVVDVAMELQKIQDGLASNGYTSTPNAIVSATLATDTGSQQYQLHQYAVSSVKSGVQLYGGQEFGYVPFSNGYLFVQGNCNTTNELPTTLPALQAIKFDGTTN